MKFFDFNVHLPCGQSDLDSRLQDESNMSGAAFESCFQGYKQRLDDNCVGANIMILNSKLTNLEVESLVNKTKFSLEKSCVTMMVNPRDVDWNNRINNLHDIGVTAIKFHSYIPYASYFLR